MRVRTAAAQTSSRIGGTLSLHSGVVVRFVGPVALVQALRQLGDLLLQLDVAHVRPIAFHFQRGAGALQRVVLLGHVVQLLLDLLQFGLLAVARCLGGDTVFQFPVRQMREVCCNVVCTDAILSSCGV